MQTLKTIAATSAIAVMAAAPASALSVSDITGIWTDAQLASEDGYLFGEGTNEIRWGGVYPGEERSGFRFEGNAPPTQTVMPGESFRLGDFTHINLPVFPPSITSANLNLRMLLDGNQTFSATYRFTLDETPNDQSHCPYGNFWSNWNGCADLVEFSMASSSNDLFEVDGERYRFDLSGFRVGGEIPVESFVTSEDRYNTAGLYGSFEQVAPVPLPASGLLLLGGFGAVAWVRRKRAA